MSQIIKVAVPCPLREALDYLPARQWPDPSPGCRVSVPFGSRRVVGVVVGASEHSSLAPSRLRPIHAVLDQEPLLDADILALAQWAADYYQYPLGEVLSRCLPPPRRRDGEGSGVRMGRAWQLTAAGRDTPTATLAATPARARALEALQQATAPMSAVALANLGIRAEIVRALGRDGLVAPLAIPLSLLAEQPPTNAALEAPLAPNPDQTAAIEAIKASLDGFGTTLLAGVTGSGKTEVYLSVMSEVLARGRQALLLVPEIGLTPQTVHRLQARFGSAVAAVHSGMASGQRLAAWELARSGRARILVGTRSAIFTPLPDLGVIIVDEEHDDSYKQQDGLRYSARDLAVIRARNRDIPVVLGSATPSLESLNNALTGRYRHLRLPLRAGGASPPRQRLIDLRRHGAPEGFSTPLIDAMRAALGKGNQVLVFINRRGFAPVLMCHDCGWIAECRRCDARMTVHSRPAGLRCHHCGAERPMPPECPSCGAPEPMPIGQGTQRSENVLGQLFPDTPVIRIDRDSTRGARALGDTLERVARGSPALLVGTQMLAKGHHFPAVTLVAVLDADSGLFSADFRSSERLAQQLLQVSGRAGRADRAGEVLIQTHQPDHPLWHALLEHGYDAFATAALAERREAGFPPFGHLALLRAEAPAREPPHAFLEHCARLLREGGNEVAVLGPVPALLERRAGRYRAQLLLQSRGRTALQRLLRSRLEHLEALPEARRVRWSLDVDPVDLA